MITRTVNYVNFKGQKKDVKLHFSLDTKDAVKLTEYLEQKYQIDDLVVYLQNVVESANGKELLRVVDDILVLTYGEPSADGEYFDKSQEVQAKFSNSAVYADFFEQMMINPQLFVDFANDLFSQARVTGDGQGSAPNVVPISAPTPVKTPEQKLAEVMADPIQMARLLEKMEEK